MAATNDKVEVEQTPAASAYVTVAEINAAAPVFVKSGVGHAKGLVPDPGAAGGTQKYLNEDATFKAVPISINALANIAVPSFGTPFTPSTISPSIVLIDVYVESDGLVAGSLQFTVGGTVVGFATCNNSTASGSSNRMLITLPVALNEAVQIDNITDPNSANVVNTIYYRTITAQ